jgi:hypothetical protein
MKHRAKSKITAEARKKGKNRIESNRVEAKSNRDGT